MVRVEPRSVDLERWPTLVPPANGGQSGSVAEALRRSARELGLRIDYPDDSAAGVFEAPARMVLVDPERFWARLATGGVTGLAESYMAGEWQSPDLPTVLGVLVPWVATHPDCPTAGNRAGGRESRGRRRVREGVDLEDGLPGDLCALYTDETMSTTGALFASGARTRTTATDGTEVVTVQAPSATPRRTDLADAQRRSADVALALAGVRAGSRVLVAPPGWGELPMRAAELGGRVRVMTGSTERLTMLGARFSASGLDESITLSLGEVDEISGTLDAIVADEPAPAAGLHGVAAVLSVAARSLRPGGRLVVQTMLAAGGGGASASALTELAAWQAGYISDTAPVAGERELAEVVAVHPGLRMRGRVDMTAHHAETARLWSENFAIRGRDAAALGFDAVYRRMWAFHLAAVETGLRRGWVESSQFLLEAVDPSH